MSSHKIAKSEIAKVSELKPHPKNYRVHGQDQLAHIIESIKSNGFYKNVVVAKDGTILAGHGAVEACRVLKIDKIPVVRLNLKPDDVRSMKILAGDNEVAKLAEVNDRLLTEILKDISTNVEGLLGTGFDEKQLANLVFVTRHNDEIKDFNAAQEWVGLPSYDEKDPALDNDLLLVITFKNAKDRENFVDGKKIKIRDKRGDRRWSTCWPFEERNDLKSVKFEEAGK